MKREIHSEKAGIQAIHVLFVPFLGNASDSLSYHNGTMFTIKGRDNDEESGGNCAHTFRGGWWFSNCNTCNLNGLYLEMLEQSQFNDDLNESDAGITWFYWENNYKSMKDAEMKVRPLKFRN